ncbi:MAG: clan AA aspartic protease [Tildeniella nuda ZEHNDER 1965/U140]|jgi:clan AA aspartic protease|nr:clan AA aspartic protease [Tildeniella nuda ZEHNDER 1965/U140]
MIFGFVQNREAIVQLAIIGDQQKQQGIRAVMDTGFTGSLTLPPTIIAALALTWFTQQEGFLGDGSRRTFDVYRGTVIWNGQLRAIEINASDTAPLVGMALLEGFELRIQAYEGGSVAILPIA